jgi:hypothetical protein
VLNTTTLSIEAVARRLVTEYRRVFGRREPDSLRKQTALFYGLLEIGLAPRLGYACPADLGDGYAGCFGVKVEP